TGIAPSQSPIWKSLPNYIQETKQDSKLKRYYEWDYLHGDIEVYNSREIHLGCIDSFAGEWIKGAVKGRKITL
ncbi:unnamed protein product, partial [Rotaria magnacalcarata]